METTGRTPQGVWRERDRRAAAAKDPTRGGRPKASRLRRSGRIQRSRSWVKWAAPSRMAAWPPIRRKRTRSRSKARKRAFIVEGFGVLQETAHLPGEREPPAGRKQQPVLTDGLGFEVPEDGRQDADAGARGTGHERILPQALQNQTV